MKEEINDLILGEKKMGEENLCFLIIEKILSFLAPFFKIQITVEYETKETFADQSLLEDFSSLQQLMYRHFTQDDREKVFRAILSEQFAIEDSLEDSFYSEVLWKAIGQFSDFAVGKSAETKFPFSLGHIYTLAFCFPGFNMVEKCFVCLVEKEPDELEDDSIFCNYCYRQEIIKYGWLFKFLFWKEHLPGTQCPIPKEVFEPFNAYLNSIINKARFPKKRIRPTELYFDEEYYKDGDNDMIKKIHIIAKEYENNPLLFVWKNKTFEELDQLPRFQTVPTELLPNADKYKECKGKEIPNQLSYCGGHSLFKVTEGNNLIWDSLKNPISGSCLPDISLNFEK